jgi:hypothetical protein
MTEGEAASARCDRIEPPRHREKRESTAMDAASDFAQRLAIVRDRHARKGRFVERPHGLPRRA